MAEKNQVNAKKFERRPPALVAALLCVALASAASSARAQGAVVPLPSDMQAAANKYLPGVVGAPVAAFAITSDLANLSAGTRTYAIVSGPNAGNTELHVIAPVPGDATGQKWSYAIGNTSVDYLNRVPGQSLSVTADENISQGVITRYQPAEPLLIAGMNAGDSQTTIINASVYDLGSAGGSPEYTGTLTQTLTYVGAYQVTVPAGTFNAALLKWTFQGSVGPASVNDTQARFVVPGVGMVAAAEKLDISAFLIYNDKTKVGKVLAQLP
jgi:hypothetical protein